MSDQQRKRAIKALKKALVTYIPQTKRDLGVALTAAALAAEYLDKTSKHDVAFISPKGIAVKTGHSERTSKRHFSEFRRLRILPPAEPTRHKGKRAAVHRDVSLQAIIAWLSDCGAPDDLMADVTEQLVAAFGAKIMSASPPPAAPEKPRHETRDAATQSAPEGRHKVAARGVTKGCHEEGCHERCSCHPTYSEKPVVSGTASNTPLLDKHGASEASADFSPPEDEMNAGLVPETQSSVTQAEGAELPGPEIGMAEVADREASHCSQSIGRGNSETDAIADADFGRKVGATGHGGVDDWQDESPADVSSGPWPQDDSLETDEAELREGYAPDDEPSAPVLDEARTATSLMLAGETYYAAKAKAAKMARQAV